MKNIPTTSDDSTNQTRYAQEQAFFDEVASNRNVETMNYRTLERYRQHKNANLFSKEFMFSLLSDPHGKRVVEVGCGEGIASVQLAYCGAEVTGLDISPKSIEVASKRAKLNGLNVRFLTHNIELDDIPSQQFDVVWCDLILHHLIPNLDNVIAKLKSSLKDGGIFIAREPVAYATWLKNLRRMVPVNVPTTDDEQPLLPEHFNVIRCYFPDLHVRYFRLFARIDRITPSLRLIGIAAYMDNFLLRIPGVKQLAGNVVVWSRKKFET